MGAVCWGGVVASDTPGAHRCLGWPTYWYTGTQSTHLLPGYTPPNLLVQGRRGVLGIIDSIETYIHVDSK